MDFFANLAVNAALQVKTEGAAGKVKCPISNIHILKSHGQSSTNSVLVDGYALNCSKAAQVSDHALDYVVRDCAVVLHSARR